MFLIIGLGNPGQKYKNSRHNIGFRILAQFQKENDFPSFNLIKKFYSQVSGKRISEKKIIIAKPQTFMNQSGLAVKSLKNFYKVKPPRIVIVHDDIDLPFGQIRISKNRGSAGHKGVESIIKHLGTKNFLRLRVGIKPQKGKSKNPEKFVLQNFTKSEEKTLKQVIKKACGALKKIIIEGIDKAMNEFN